MPRQIVTRVFSVILVLLAVPAFALARQASPSPVGDSAPVVMTPVETLLEVAVPAEAIPAGPVLVSLGRWTWTANATASVPAGAWQRGVVVDRVLSGSYAARSGGPVLLARSGGDRPVEEIAAGTEFVVDTGGGAAYLQNEASWEFRNAGTEPGVGLGGGIFSTAPPTNPGSETEIGLSLFELASIELDGWDTGGAETATFTYWRATLAPGAEIPAAAEGAVQLVATETGGTPELTTAPDGAARNDGQRAIDVFGLTLAP
jgi:hypothetical protein